MQYMSRGGLSKCMTSSLIQSGLELQLLSHISHSEIQIWSFSIFIHKVWSKHTVVTGACVFGYMDSSAYALVINMPTRMRLSWSFSL